jgi:hypothetical protein
LTTKRHNIIIERDFAVKQAKKYWVEAKEYEAQGWMEMALETKNRCEEEAYRVKCYNN